MYQYNPFNEIPQNTNSQSSVLALNVPSPNIPETGKASAKTLLIATEIEEQR